MIQEFKCEKMWGWNPGRMFAVPAALWILLTSLNLLDYFATKHALSNGCRELNPFVARLFQIDEFNAVLATKLLFLAVLFVLLPFVKSWKLNLLAIATLLYAAVATYHLYGAYLFHFM
ncbi:MAG: hypothetical protein A4E70_00501 [Syntrophus sp. PtaU1.Bin005]|uniref:DUF5658 family protein n=1 Tax=Syntrophus TaxID=43773 RepID=UPI0009D454FC|nr:MAG: hypothetical protein A4E69_00110 [Syntrophus sp. PtaB.Bin138]OPY83031.1 MAG: hypothetical protein A4E70_00501 [Syntrophus sp. PtaU1.Bin005]